MSGIHALAVLDQGRIPSIFQSRSSQLNAAAQTGINLGFAVVTLRGKIWRLVYQGTDDIVRDPLRPEQPAATIEVVIVGAAEGISKQFYAKPYVEGSDSPPDCYSFAGIKPEANSPQKQAPLCATCPQNQWGSRMTDDNRKAKRCQDTKRLAIVPSGDLENEAYGGPMLLRIPPTSLAVLALYAGNLSRLGAPMEGVVTRIGFNPENAYPQLTFTPVRWLSDQEALLIVGPDGKGGVMQHPVISRILFDSVAANVGSESEPTPKENEEQGPQPQPAPPPPPPPPQPEPNPAAAQAIAEAQAAAAYAAQKQAELEAAQAAQKQNVMPIRRPAAFGGAAQSGAAQSAETPPPNGVGATVSVAPAGLQKTIDSLLATQVS